MTKNEFNQAFKLAEGPADGRDPSAMNDGVFDGFGLDDFPPVTCTIKQVASLIVYQCRYLNGGWDAEALTNIYPQNRGKFIIAG